jgi:hypothetical protein
VAPGTRGAPRAVPHTPGDARSGRRSILSDLQAREIFGLQSHQDADLAGILFPCLSPLTGLRVGGRIRLDQGIDHRRLGWWCRRVRRRVIGGLRLDVDGTVSGVARWRIAEVAAGGFGGHVPAADDTNQPRNGSWDRSGTGKYAGQPEHDPQNPDDHLGDEDEGAAFEEGEM